MLLFLYLLVRMINLDMNNYVLIIFLQDMLKSTNIVFPLYISTCQFSYWQIVWSFLFCSCLLAFFPRSVCVFTSVLLSCSNQIVYSLFFSDQLNSSLIFLFLSTSLFSSSVCVCFSNDISYVTTCLLSHAHVRLICHYFVYYINIFLCFSVFI